MHKHRGFPSRLPSSDFQFTIRRANPRGVTPLVARERFRDRRHADKKADEGFMAALWHHFGEEPFERGNLDAGRLGWLLGREVVAVDKDAFDPNDYEAMLRIDVAKAKISFPAVFDEGSDFFEEDDEEWD
ncbi:hypothetical protein HCZ30_07385 [Marivivens donghaensis]|uniref:Uncharacterized protein n=1 Tax=Marivivens donghaensis TaxID=1699413 RepID=A0ABX0VYE3_9RHOB|nr:hypothetical protein [Marivivens donghaensis]NIY72256.1 hypothetical protein [Marivivens donghaensis]